MIHTPNSESRGAVDKNEMCTVSKYRLVPSVEVGDTFVTQSFGHRKNLPQS